MSYQLDDIIVAPATVPGTGAIGIVRLSGEGCISLVNKGFTGKIGESHKAIYGFIKDGEETIDEVMVTAFKAPKSYTTEDMVEISCHASSYIMQKLIELLCKHGGRSAEPGEFTLRAFLNGRIDLSQAEAVADIIASENEQSHKLALGQLRGGISNEIIKLRQELIDFAALIELELDFGEEDVEFADREKLQNLILKIQSLLSNLISTFALGNAIKKGINTVIAGRPNAGKSTLLNALLKEDRAIVSEIAGTTRDTIEGILNINGIDFRFIDTAGIRDATDTIEKMGIEKTMQKAQQSTILIYVYDVTSVDRDEIDKDVMSIYQEGMKVIILGNKMDIPMTMHDNPLRHHDEACMKEYKAKNWKAIDDKWKEMNFVLDVVSAKEGTYLDRLKENIYKLVVDTQLSNEQTIVTNARHYDSLHGAHDSLGKALENLKANISGDLVAMDIRHSLNYLGEITGEINSDDLLESIFSRFCIGK